MAAKWIELVTGPLEQKKQWREAVARMDALPEPYRNSAKAIQRYLLHAGGITDAATLITMIGDFADLWERAAVDGAPIRDVVGEDPVEFAEAFCEAYSGRQWVDKERGRLRDAIDSAERDAATGDPR
jgi:DNA-binding ferritin-like protein (Dps family)